MIPKYDYELEFTIDGIPCLIGVDGTNYRSCEVTILDRKGRPAPWLEAKMTARDRLRLWDVVRDELTPAFMD